MTPKSQPEEHTACSGVVLGWVCVCKVSKGIQLTAAGCTLVALCTPVMLDCRGRRDNRVERQPTFLLTPLVSELHCIRCIMQGRRSISRFAFMSPSLPLSPSARAGNNYAVLWGSIQGHSIVVHFFVAGVLLPLLAFVAAELCAREANPPDLTPPPLALASLDCTRAAAGVSICVLGGAIRC